MSRAISLGSYASRWLQRLVPSKSISGSLSSSYTQIKFFSSSFALTRLVRKLSKIGSNAKDVVTIWAKGKNASYKSLSKKTLNLTAALSSGASSVSKTVLTADMLYASRADLSQQSRYALAETSSYAGLVGGVISLITCCWNMVDLYKKNDVSELKKRQIDIKKFDMNLKLISKVSAVAASVLGCIAVAVTTAVIPWVVLALNTVTFVISFTKRVKDAILVPSVSMRQRYILSK